MKGPLPVFAIRLLERNLLPDAAIRAGIRRIIASRLDALDTADAAGAGQRLAQFVRERSEGPIAIATRSANAQHYEVPTEFYRLVLGRHLKYSSACWDAGAGTLDDAEARMLALCAERAQLTDGQRVLELGCGWGSFALWMARAFPASRITGVSNSRSQKAWIDGVARQENLRNLEIVTADMNTFDAAGRFDRIVSIEMFEHMRNYERLLARIAGWLRPAGALLVHVFAHRRHAYPFEDAGASDWMAREFFTGGLMPSTSLLHHFQRDLLLDGEWHLSGTHYARTAEAWYANLMAAREPVRALFAEAYGRADDAERRFQRWRVFFLACAELFGYRGGREWLVAHYRFRPR